MEVLVYKTNIHLNYDVERIKPFFNEHTDIIKWHVDIEDVDRVLRIEAQENISDKIENIVRAAGYWCGELE